MGRIEPRYCKGNDTLVRLQTESRFLISDKQEEKLLILSALLLTSYILLSKSQNELQGMNQLQLQ